MSIHSHQATIPPSTHTIDSPEDLRKAQNFTPSHEAIAKKAYEIWLAHKKEPGRELQDWLEAERKLKQRGYSGQPK